MELSEVRNDFFRQNGFMVVPKVLSQAEVETLRRRADEIARDYDGYVRRDGEEREKLLARWRATMGHGEGEAAADRETGMHPDVEEPPEVRVTDRHARRGDRVYPVRKHAIDKAAVKAALASDAPFVHGIPQILYTTDNDEVFHSFAAHPNIVAVLQEILGLNAKLWFDHVYNKPPFNYTMRDHGANRYHQDGFFQFDRRNVTCWVSLDGLTVDNGPFHYIPLTAGYGQFRFDKLGEGVTARELEQEVVVTLEPGDAVFHDRWTLHGTGPNESPQRRRGWALHYVQAESKYGDHVNDAEGTGWADGQSGFVQASGGLHLRDRDLGNHEKVIDGNRHYQLVCGREFPGCV